MFAKQKNWIALHAKTLAVVLLFAAGLAVYANSLGNQMFWDDDDSILKNKFVQDWRYIPEYFTENLIAGAGLRDNYWRPMLLFTYSVEWHLWGSWSPGYHAINVLFHIGDAILLFFILSLIFKDRLLSWLTALIFLVHPLQTEAVTYVAGLGDSLSAMFIFIGLLQYLKWRESGRPPWSGGRYWLAVSMYAMALMSKETAIIMPAYVLVADFFRVREGADAGLKKRLKDIGQALLPFIVLAGIYLLLRATALNFINTFNLYNEANEYTSHFSYRLFTFFRVLAVYAGLLFVPLGLHMERTVEIAKTLFLPDVAFGALLCTGLLALALSQVRRRPMVSFGIIWCFIGLAPTSNLAVPINGMIYEHWLYLPLIGVFLSLIWLGSSVARRPVGKWLAVGFFCAFLICFSVLTVARNRIWHDPIVFYNDVLRYNQSSYRVFNNLGNAYSDAKDYAKAEETYRKAIDLDPENAVAYFNLGNTYRDMEQAGLAIEQYKKAIGLSPEVHFYSNNLAALYLKLGRRQEAKQVLEDHARYAAYKNNALVSLTLLAAEDGDFQAALGYLDQAAAADPRDPRLGLLRDQVIWAMRTTK